MTRRTGFPFSTVPEKILPMAMTPEWGSTSMVEMHMSRGPSALTSDTDLPTSEVRSPGHMTGALYCWAVSGLGRCSTNMSSTVWCSGDRLLSSSRLPPSLWASMISLKVILFCCMWGRLVPHL